MADLLKFKIMIRSSQHKFQINSYHHKQVWKKKRKKPLQAYIMESKQWMERILSKISNQRNSLGKTLDFPNGLLIILKVMNYRMKSHQLFKERQFHLLLKKNSRTLFSSQKMEAEKQWHSEYLLLWQLIH